MFPILAALLLTAAPAGADDLTGIYREYPFLRSAVNQIQNADEGLLNLRTALKELKAGQRSKVVIAQVGDSHIQADYFSGTVRAGLQRDRGNAGRGLVFPYRVAGTTEPLNFRSSGTGRWEARRNIAAGPFPIGVSGIALRARQPESTVTLRTEDVGELSYAFNRVTLFFDKGPESYDLLVSREGGAEASRVSGALAPGPLWYSTVNFPTKRNDLVVRTVRSDARQKQSILWGLVLENGEPGLLWHTIGVNGARFKDYNFSELYFAQLADLAPDLVIVSLGTNEADGTVFKGPDFEEDIRLFVKTLRDVLPRTSILFTSPPDALRQRRYRNPNPGEAAAIEGSLARDTGLAFWDFYQVMGGYGAMEKWKKSGLAQRDGLHLNVDGYILQGRLFLEALRPAMEARGIQ